MQKLIYLFSTSLHSDVKSINSLDIKILKPSIDFLKYDYLIITSKQTVNALKQYGKSEYTHISALCISEKTAEAYEAIDGKVLACANGFGNDIPKIIKKFSHSKKWLYLRAKVVASDFVSECRRDGYSIDEEVLYESKCSSEIMEVEVEEDATLIFTSPSSIKCFLKKHTIGPHNEIVVIGATTAKILPKNQKYHQSESATIESCIELAQKF